MLVNTKEKIKEPFLAPLGEFIYELIGRRPEVGETVHHSLAHVVVPVGKASPKHYHKIAEESYHVLKGQARMIIDGNEFTLSSGETLLIKPGAIHQLFNDGPEVLELLAVSAPAWILEDFFDAS